MRRFGKKAFLIERISANTRKTLSRDKPPAGAINYLSSYYFSWGWRTLNNIVCRFITKRSWLYIRAPLDCYQSTQGTDYQLPLTDCIRRFLNLNWFNFATCLCRDDSSRKSSCELIAWQNESRDCSSVSCKMIIIDYVKFISQAEFTLTSIVNRPHYHMRFRRSLHVTQKTFANHRH